MHRLDKAVLRLATGMAAAAAVAYGAGLPSAFVVCLMSVLLLAKPGPPMPLGKGLVVAAIATCILAGGVVMVPVLEHYRFAGLLLTAAVLYAVFLAGARSANPLAAILVMAFTFIPVVGVAEQAVAIALAQAVGLGLAIGVVVSGLSHALFPDAPMPGAKAAATGANAEAARWGALQATLVIMPVFVLALTNPAFYVAAIMKTVAVGQQASATNARSAGRELVGSTLMGAGMGAVLWFGLTLRPNLWMLVLWLAAAALWTGVRLFGVKASAFTPSFWLNALLTMLILLGPAIEDASVGKDVYNASLTRVSLFIGVALYAWAMVWALERWRARRSGALRMA